MTTITAIVLNGRLETAQPVNLPDGTELTIPISARPLPQLFAELVFMTEDVQTDDPVTVQQWIDELESIPPVPEDAKSRDDVMWQARMRHYNIDAMRKQLEEGVK